MNGRKTVTLSFDTLGNSKVDANGFTGNSCADATKSFISLLSAKEVEDTKKPEYGLPNNSGNRQTQGW